MSLTYVSSILHIKVSFTHEHVSYLREFYLSNFTLQL